MKRLSCMCAAALAVTAGIADATVNLELPEGFQQIIHESSDADSASFPVGSGVDGKFPVQIVDGTVERIVFRTDRPQPTLDLLRTLSSSLQQRGYAEIFRCYDRQCGGFSFLSGLEIVPPPEMFVDLGDFRFLTARKGGPGAAELVSVLASSSSNTGFVQVTVAQETPHLPDDPSDGDVDVDIIIKQVANRESTAGDDGSGDDVGPVVQQLLFLGRAVLTSLEFAIGSLSLAGGDSAELEELSGFLEANPEAIVVLVGHTDAEGALESNIELSQRRAVAVLDLLVSQYGVNPDQLQAEGIGYLAPRATNATEEGRSANRRVEVVLVRQN